MGKNTAFEMCKNVPWAITEESLRLILAIANRELFAVNPVSSDVVGEPIQAVELESGVRLAGTQNVHLRGRTAIIPIYGPIVRHASFFSEFSGATSIEMIAKDFNTAINSEDVDNIIFDVDSPGGEVNGTAELASLIYGARSKKKMWTYAGNQMCSAAYWIGSATEKVIVADTALVGSIGVIAAMPDPKKTESDEVVFVSSQSPNKRVDINTKEGRSQVQTTIDDIAAVFITAVARNRDVTEATVEDDFGQGGVFVGQKSVIAGLADEVGSLESAIASLAESANTDSKIIAEDEDLSVLDDIKKLLAVEPLEENSVSDTPTTPIVAADVTPPVQVTPPVTNTQSIVETDEYKALQAENRRLRLVGYNARAEQYADNAITQARAFPSERATLIQAYVQACFDDQTFGNIDANGASRVSILETMMANRPANQLTAESINSEVLKIIRAPETTDNNAPLSKEEVLKLAGLTSAGQEAIKGASK